MAFSSGSIASATPHTALSTQIKALFGGSGVANWSFVENIPAGGGSGQSGSASYSVDVYKCAGSGTDANDAATDWYFAFRIPVSDGTVSSGFTVYEDYEGGANKRFKRPVAASASNAPTGSGDWRSDTYANAASVTGQQALVTPTLNTTGFNYWIKLTNNAIWVALTVGIVQFSWTAGLGDTLVNPDFIADTCPLFAQSQPLGNANTMYASREPGVTDATVSKWAYSSCANWTPWSGSNATNGFDLFADSKVAVSRIMIRHSANLNLIGGLRALYKSDFLSFQGGGTVNQGDTVDIDGVTYVVMQTNTQGGSVVGGIIITPDT